jgi:hypothetical protein
MDNTQMDQFDTSRFLKDIIQAEREKDLRGEGKSMSWEEVKNMAINKEQRNLIMPNSSIQLPLSNVQAELLKLFSAGIPENHLLELKKVMAKFLLDKARDKADAAWDENEYTDEKLQQILGNK